MVLNIPGFESLFKRDRRLSENKEKNNNVVFNSEKKSTEVIVDINQSGDTDDIEEAIKMIEEGGVIRIKDGVYKVRKRIDITKNNITIKGSGTGTTIQPNTQFGDSSIFKTNGVTNITFKDMTFNLDENISVADIIPIYIYNSTYVTAKNIKVENSTTEGFYIDNSDNNIITENFQDSGVVLVTCYQAEKNIISKNICQGIRIANLVLGGNHDNQITENNAYGTGTTGVNHAVHFSNGGGDNNVISNNRIDNFNYAILTHANCDKTIITSNNMVGTNGISDSGTNTVNANNVS